MTPIIRQKASDIWAWSVISRPSLHRKRIPSSTIFPWPADGRAAHVTPIPVTAQPHRPLMVQKMNISNGPAARNTGRTIINTMLLTVKGLKAARITALKMRVNRTITILNRRRAQAVITNGACRFIFLPSLPAQSIPGMIYPQPIPEASPATLWNFQITRAVWITTIPAARRQRVPIALQQTAVLKSPLPLP